MPPTAPQSSSPSSTGPSGDTAPPDLTAMVDAAVAKANAPRIEPCVRCGIATTSGHPRGWCRFCRLDDPGAMDVGASADDRAAGLLVGMAGGACRPGFGAVLRRSGILVDWSETGRTEANRRRWQHIDQEAVAAAWDAAYGVDPRDAVVRGRVGWSPREILRNGEPVPLRDPGRPPTDLERMRAVIEQKRQQAEDVKRQRATRMRQATKELARWQRRVAKLASTNGQAYAR